ncbi:MAG: glycosyl transferase family 2 [Bacteroidetes bacterium]|nr:glycosyl transferase family 2 [Bacteroidota bacterium]
MKISIVTVTYNSASTIRDTLESVLNQTYSNIEYIVVDGKSDDSTINIVQDYEPKFGNRIKWISEPDSGLYDAMNKGIGMATGDIIGIINSDDFYHQTDIISKIVKAFEDNPDAEATMADIRFVKPSNLDKTVRYYSSKKFKPGLFRYGFMPAHPSFFTYKHNFTRYGLYKTDYKIAADYELLIRFLYKMKIKCVYIPIDVMKMRTGGTSQFSLRNTYLLNKEIIRACKENGIYTNLIILYLKYIIKLREFIFTNK